MTDEKFPATQAQRESGDWNPFWDMLEEMNRDYLEAFLAFRSVPIKQGPLPQKTKEFIFIAVNAATTHLWAPGVRRHIRNALREGATQEEILEVIQLTSIMGIHSLTLGAPILQDEVTEYENSK